MVGRWARLAVQAQSSGALNYKHITDKDEKSLDREALILDELERQRVSSYWQLEMQRLPLMVMTGQAESALKLAHELSTQYRQELLPWMNDKSFAKEARDRKRQKRISSDLDLTDGESVESYYNAMIANSAKIREMKMRKKEKEENGQ